MEPLGNPFKTYDTTKHFTIDDVGVTLNLIIFTSITNGGKFHLVPLSIKVAKAEVEEDVIVEDNLNTQLQISYLPLT